MKSILSIKKIYLVIFLISSLCACQPVDVVNPYDGKYVDNSKQVHDYSSCVRAGNKITRSYPPKCITTDGRTFVSEALDIGAGRNSIKTNQGSCKNMCGDGICQEIVCQAIGCPCSESSATCPSDCS